MKAFGQSMAIGKMLLRPALREPFSLVLVSLLPLSFILIFYLVGGRSLSDQALLGTLVVFASNVGVVQLPQICVTHRYWGLQDMFVASPVGPLAYASGIGLSRLIYVAPALALLLVVMVSKGAIPLSALPSVLLVLLACWLMGIFLGFALTALVPNVYKISMFANAAGLLLSVLPPVYYPLDLVTESMRWLPLLVPTTHAAQLLRLSCHMAESTATMQALHWLYLWGIILACGLLVARKLSWQEKEST